MTKETRFALGTFLMKSLLSHPAVMERALNNCQPCLLSAVQGLHNNSYNMQSVPNALSTRNPGLGGGLSSGAHQSAGSLPAGRFGSNLPVGLSQVPFPCYHSHFSHRNILAIMLGFSSNSIRACSNGCALKNECREQLLRVRCVGCSAWEPL